MMQFKIRNYSVDDFKKFEEFDQSDRDESRLEEKAYRILKAKQQKPHYNSQQDFFIAEKKERIVGFGDVTPELRIGRIILDGYIHPEYRRKGLGSEMMTHMTKRGEHLGTKLAHVCISEGNIPAKNFLLKSGFSYMRCFLDMEVNLLEISKERLDSPSYTVSDFREGNVMLLADIQNKIFSGSWGFCPNTADEIKYYLDLTGSQLEDILIIKEGARTAGYLWSHMLSRRDQSQEGKRGRIHMYGIEPEFRGGGLGKKLLIKGLFCLNEKGVEIVELTVDEENTPALSLYKSLGFRVIARKIWYEKKLD